MSKKLAIQINNKREFDLLMKHYESKGWKRLPDTKIKERLGYCIQIEYMDDAGYYEENEASDRGYLVIDFTSLAILFEIKTDEITIELSADIKAVVTKIQANIFYGDCKIVLHPHEVSEIHTAFQSLQ